MSGFPRRRVAHSGLITQVISAFGLASRIAATAGSVCTTSPSELGLMIRIDLISDFKERRCHRHDAVKPWNSKRALSAEFEAIGQQTGQTGLNDLLLRGREVVFYAPLFDHMVFDVINAIGGAPIAVARLADAADVNEIFLRFSIGS